MKISLRAEEEASGCTLKNFINDKSSINDTGQIILCFLT